MPHRTESTIVLAIDAAHRENRTADEYELRLRQAELPKLPAPQRVEALIRAAVLAEKLGRPHDAADAADRALDLAVAHADGPGRINALSELGVQARTRGDLERSETLLREAALLAGEHGDKRLTARARGNLAVTLRRAGKPDRAFDEGTAAARLYRDLGDLAGANRMLHLQSQIQQDQGLLQEAKATLEEVIGLDALIGDSIGHARSLGNLGLLLWRMGELAEAAAKLEQTMEFFLAGGSRIDVIRARSNLGLIRRSMGETNAALACFEQSAAEAAELGLTVERAHALSNLAATLVMYERWDEAEELLSSVSTGGDYRREHTDLLTRARIAIHRGDSSAALGYARDATEIARKADNPRCVAEALRIQAQVLHGKHEDENAREAILQALEQLEQGGRQTCEEHLVCTAVAAAIEHALGADDEARTLAQDAADGIERHLRNPDPEVQHALASLKVLAARS
jgi:tetratricopeptide (TPR) repeat protein